MADNIEVPIIDDMIFENFELPSEDEDDFADDI